MHIYVIIYCVVAVCFAYFTSQILGIADLLYAKADVKKRAQIIEKQKQLKLHLKLSPIWPFLLLKEVYDAVKAKKRS